MMRKVEVFSHKKEWLSMFQVESEKIKSGAIVEQHK
jgi:hypothetical protein